MLKKMNDLVQGVIWPAIAGNVVWAFISIAVKEGFFAPESPVRLTTLALLGIYLCVEWLHTEKYKTTMKENYWIFDLLLAAPIAVFAIMMEARDPLVLYALAGVFTAGVFGHGLGGWTTTDKAGRDKEMIGVHILGVVFLILAWLSGSTGVSWWLTVAVGVVVALWWYLRCFQEAPVRT